MLSATNEFHLTLPVVEQPDTAAGILSERLRNGQLVLVLGAGASYNADIPMWHQLVKLCCTAIGVPESIVIKNPSATSSRHLQMLMSQVRDKVVAAAISADQGERDYKDLVRANLYSKVRPDWLVNPNDPLLNALSALLMGSRAGTIGDVITYNFDDVIEQYVNHHGLITQTIMEFPTLAGDVDVRMYHPHGYLSRDGSASSSSLVFDRESFGLRASSATDWDAAWQDTLQGLLVAKQAIFVGLSGEDPLFETLLPRLNRQLSVENDDGRRYVGYWVAGSTLEESLKHTIRKSYGCPLIELPGHDYIPRFLLLIRQLCAGYSPASPFGTAPATP